MLHRNSPPVANPCHFIAISLDRHDFVTQLCRFSSQRKAGLQGATPVDPRLLHRIIFVKRGLPGPRSFAMKMLFATRAQGDQKLAWNDIEALPIYAAMALILACLVLALLDSTPTIYAIGLKVVGIMGGLALRHAWLKLDEEEALF
jgi:hypothetical protein